MAPVIQVSNLSKQYRLGERVPYYSIRDSLARIIKSAYHQSSSKPAPLFKALNNVSFDVEAGESIGIIGPNGAGKSTLLKILSRITPPTSGQALLKGRVASLLEVGTGFHQELTGRENIFLNGTILGMTRNEILTKYKTIVEFSGVEKFLNTPVKHYSTGMRLRLAFAVAAHLEPEILLIDEVLAVGDAQFQQKSLGQMTKITRSGRTIIFVSHNLAAVEQLCKRSIFVKDGKIAAIGNTSEIIRQYVLEPDSSFANLDYLTKRTGTGDCRLKTIKIESVENRKVIKTNDHLKISVIFDEAARQCKKVRLILGFYDSLGNGLFRIDTGILDHSVIKKRRLTIETESINFTPMTCYLNYSLQVSGLEADHAKKVLTFEIQPPAGSNSEIYNRQYAMSVIGYRIF